MLQDHTQHAAMRDHSDWAGVIVEKMMHLLKDACLKGLEALS
jgi:hypothetical protein